MPTATTKPGLMNETNSSIKDSHLQSIIRRNQSIIDHYIVDRDCFARGKFAQVRRIQHKQTGKLYAAKTIRKRRPRCGNVTDEIMHEIRVLLTANRCPRIVGLFEVFETASEYILVLELAEGGELQQILEVDEYISEDNCRILMRQIIEGIRYLHSHQIAHLDIKPQNILLTSPLPEGEVKLCDFGISRLILDGYDIREIMGTTDYMPPEVLQYEPITLASDMWSIGIVTYVLLSGHSPFGGDDKVHTYSNITSGSLDFPDKLFGSVSELAKDFIQKLLIQDPKGRLTCDECLEHDWLKLTKSNFVNLVDSDEKLPLSSIIVPISDELNNGLIEFQNSNSNCDDDDEVLQNVNNDVDNGNDDSHAASSSNVVDLNGNFLNHNANHHREDSATVAESANVAAAAAETNENSVSKANCDSCDNNDNKLQQQSCQQIINEQQTDQMMVVTNETDHHCELEDSDMSLAPNDNDNNKENQSDCQFTMDDNSEPAEVGSNINNKKLPFLLKSLASGSILASTPLNSNSNLPMPSYSKLQQKRHSSDIFPESPKLLAIMAATGSSVDLLRKSSTVSNVLSSVTSNGGGQNVTDGLLQSNGESMSLPSLSVATSTPVTIKIDNEATNTNSSSSSSPSSASSSPPITPNKKIYLSVDDSGSKLIFTSPVKHNLHSRSSSSSHHSFSFAGDAHHRHEHHRSVSMERLDISQSAGIEPVSLSFWSDQRVNGDQFEEETESTVIQNNNLSSISSSSFFSSSTANSSMSSNSAEITSSSSDRWNITTNTFNLSSSSCFSDDHHNDTKEMIDLIESEKSDIHQHFNSLPIQLSTELNKKKTTTTRSVTRTDDTQSSMIS